MTRKEAIGRIQEHIHIHSKKEPFTPYLDKAFDMAIEALKQERPHGRWICISLLDDYVYVKCSECGQGTRLFRDSKNEFCCIRDVRDKIVACPYCGASMRKEGEAE